jgi:hypothetical protein
VLSNPATIINMRSSMLVSPVVSTASNSGYIIVLRSSLFVIHAAYNNKQSYYGKYSAFLRAIVYCSAGICGIISVSTTWLLKSLITTLIGDFFGSTFLGTTGQRCFWIMKQKYATSVRGNCERINQDLGRCSFGVDTPI